MSGAGQDPPPVPGGQIPHVRARAHLRRGALTMMKKQQKKTNKQEEKRPQKILDFILIAQVGFRSLMLFI